MNEIEYRNRWTLTVASRDQSSHGNGAESDPSFAQFKDDVVAFCTSFAADATWLVRESEAGGGTSSIAPIAPIAPNSDYATWTKALSASIVSQTENEGSPLVFLNCEGATQGWVTCTPAVIEARYITFSDAIVAVNRIEQCESAMSNRGYFRATNLQQKEVQHARERFSLWNDLKTWTMISGLQPPQAATNGLIEIAHVGWITTLADSTLKYPELLAPGVRWTPGHADGCGLLQVGEGPEDFTFEMAESVHRACGNPTLEEMRTRLAALQA